MEVSNPEILRFYTTPNIEIRDTFFPALLQFGVTYPHSQRIHCNIHHLSPPQVTIQQDQYHPTVMAILLAVDSVQKRKLDSERRKNEKAEQQILLQKMEAMENAKGERLKMEYVEAKMITNQLLLVQQY